MSSKWQDTRVLCQLTRGESQLGECEVTAYTYLVPSCLCYLLMVGFLGVVHLSLYSDWIDSWHSTSSEWFKSVSLCAVCVTIWMYRWQEWQDAWNLLAVGLQSSDVRQAAEPMPLRQRHDGGSALLEMSWIKICFDKLSRSAGYTCSNNYVKLDFNFDRSESWQIRNSS